MRDLIVTLIVFGTLPYVLTRPYIGVLLYSWLSYMNPHRLTWGFAYNFPFAAISAVAVFIGLILSKEKKKLPITPVTVVWMIFVFWTCVTTYFAFKPEVSVIELMRSLKIQAMILVTLMLINTKERLFQLTWVIAGSFAFFGVKGGIFTILTGGSYRVWGPPGSFVEGNNELALALIMVLPLIRFLQSQIENKWLKRALIVIIILCCFSILSSYSRGAFLAGTVMILFLWIKGNKKVITGTVITLLCVVAFTFMPQQWFERMDTISTYQQDESAMGRVNSWWFAFNLANDHPLVGGGFQTFSRDLFYIYAPIPEDHHDSHSIYFEVLAEQGYVGLLLFLLMWFLTLRTGRWIIKNTRGRKELKWACDFAAMLQVSLIAYAVGGAFLGLAYFDLPYHLMAMMVITRVIVQDAIKPGEKYSGNRVNNQIRTGKIL